MEVDVIHVTTALAKTGAERLEYQRQGKCWGCGLVGHVQAKCPTNLSKPLSIAATGETSDSGKGKSRDWTQ